MPPSQVIVFIIGTVVVLFGAYYVTYFVGMKASGQTRAGMRNRNITMLDRYSIARDKSFCVIEIASKVYIVGITGNSMTLLDTIDADTFAELTDKGDEGVSIPWSDTPVGRYGNKLTKKVVAFVAGKTGKEKEKEKENTFAQSMEEAETKLEEAAEEPKKRRGRLSKKKQQEDDD